MSARRPPKNPRVWGPLAQANAYKGMVRQLPWAVDLERRRQAMQGRLPYGRPGPRPRQEKARATRATQTTTPARFHGWYAPCPAGGRATDPWGIPAGLSQHGDHLQVVPGHSGDGKPSFGRHASAQHKQRARHGRIRPPAACLPEPGHHRGHTTAPTFRATSPGDTSSSAHVQSPERRPGTLRPP